MEPMSFELKFGNISLQVGEYPHPGPSGKIYRFPYRDPATGRRRFESATSVDGIKKKAALRAKLLAQGRSEAAHVSAADIDQLVAARRAVAIHGVPLVSAAEEWAWARSQVGSDFRVAIERWRDTRPTVTRIKVAAAVDAFISARSRPGSDPERTYRSKLTSLATALGDVYVDEIDYRRATAAISHWEDPGSQDEMAKRLGTLLRWCRKAGHLPADRTIVSELIDRNGQNRTEIEVLAADRMIELLKLIRTQHKHYLSGLVLAAFCGLRSDEIHGKRSKKGEPRALMVRQRWADVHLSRAGGALAHVVVTVAKKRTPSDRHVLIPANAIAWLRECDRTDEYVMAAGGMERVREIAAAAKIALPVNCFRHTAISAGLVHLFSMDKAKAAENFGTSVSMIDKHYRRPMTPGVARAWFAIRP